MARRIARSTKTRKAVTEPSIEDKIKFYLLPLSIFATVVATVIGVVTNWEQLVSRYEGDPVPVGAAFAAAVALISWPTIAYFGNRLSRIRIIQAQFLCIALIFGTYIYIVAYPRRCIDFNLCRFSPPALIRLNSLVGPALSAEHPPLKFVDVSVDETRSTFRLKTDDLSIHAVRETVTRLSVEFDRELLPAFQSASCRGIRGEGPIEDALPVLRYLLKARNRNDLVRKLANYAGYRDLILRGGDRGFMEARPTAAELAELQKNRPEWFALVLRWTVECVGTADPVLIWRVMNSSDRSLTLKAVEYNVLDVGQVRSAGPEMIEPIDVQPHDLFYKKGKQIRELSPNVKIGPGETAAIRIRYRLEATDWGLTWLVRPTFVTLEGVSAVGPEFKIFSAKNKIE